MQYLFTDKEYAEHHKVVRRSEKLVAAESALDYLKDRVVPYGSCIHDPPVKDVERRFICDSCPLSTINVPKHATSDSGEWDRHPLFRKALCGKKQHHSK